MKPVIDGFLIVEGTNDKSYLSSIFDVEIVCTNGFDINSTELPYIKELAKVLKPIILTDSDESGKKIREKLNNLLPNAYNVEVDVSKCNKHNKHGVAECEKSELLSVLKPFIIQRDKNIEKYNQNTLLKMGIADKNSRTIVSNHFHLGKCNSKQLSHRLSLLKIEESDIVNLLKESKSGN